jgi:hypothetical protein
MKFHDGATDNKSDSRRKTSRQKSGRDQKDKKDILSRHRPTQSLHDRRELLRAEELEEENYDKDEER